jgi:Na+/H+ antiporter NhaA
MLTDSATHAGSLSGATAWTRNLESPVRALLGTETGGAGILLVATLAALAWVNIDAASYERLWETVFTIRAGYAGISRDIHQWVNDGLMTFFFLVVGLDARRELDLGELRDRRRLAVPVAGALGGMLIAVAIYLVINAPPPEVGTAMSTDTAFALGMLALVGRRFPARLRVSVLTVAVVDDLVSFVVIATVYTHTAPTTSPT